MRSQFAHHIESERFPWASCSSLRTPKAISYVSQKHPQKPKCTCWNSRRMRLKTSENNFDRSSSKRSSCRSRTGYGQRFIRDALPNSNQDVTKPNYQRGHTSTQHLCCSHQLPWGSSSIIRYMLVKNTQSSQLTCSHQLGKLDRVHPILRSLVGTLSSNWE